MKTKLIALSIVAVAAISMTALAQPTLLWENFYGDPLSWNSFRSGLETQEGGFLCAGDMENGPIGQIYLVMTDANGNLLWERDYGGSGYDYTLDLISTQDDCYAVCGYSYDDAFLLKVEASGDSLWMQVFDAGYSEEFCGMEQTQDGGYILCGKRKTSSSTGDIFVVRTDENGNEIWSQTYTHGTQAYANWIHETDDGGFVMAGTAYSEYTVGDGFLKKVDADGNLLWTQTYTYTANINQIWDARPTDDGGYMLLYYGVDSVIGYDHRLIKTDGDGNELWSNAFTFGDEYLSFTFSMDDCDDGGYIIGALIWTSADDQGGLLKTDADGNTVWSEIYGGPQYDRISCVRQTADGGYIAVGYWGATVEDQPSAWLLRLDAEVSAVYPMVLLENIPNEFVLLSNYPNPFNPSTTLGFVLPQAEHVSLQVYSPTGALVTTLVNGWRDAGSHEVTFDASGLASGIYVYQMTAGDHTVNGKMVLMK